MTTLFPDLREELIARAESRADPTSARAASRRRPRLAAGLLAIVILGGSGVATAATLGWWSPDPGVRSDGSSRIAVATPPPAVLLESFAILRRPQNDADRAEGAIAAIQAANGPRYVRTAYVRRLSVDPLTEAYIIPTGDAETAGPSDQLCLWVAPAGDRWGSTLCVAPSEAVAGKLRLIQGAQVDAKMEAKRAAERRKLARSGERHDGLAVTVPKQTYSPSELNATVVGLAADGATTALVGGTPAAKIRDNSYEVIVNEADSDTIELRS